MAMEIITIDSSDDDDEKHGTQLPPRSTACRPPIVTPRESQFQPDDGDDDDDDDDGDHSYSSVSSADSIWDKVGLPLRISKVQEKLSAPCDRDNDTSVLVISDDECSGGSVSGDGCIFTVPSQSSLSRRQKNNSAHYQCDDSDSTVSSNDSIWMKKGLPSRRIRGGDDVVSHNLESTAAGDGGDYDDTAARHDQLNDDVGDATPHQTVGYKNFEVDSDWNIGSDQPIAKPLDAKQTQETTNFDDSSISSADSMWDKIGALKLDDPCSDCSSSGVHCVGTSLNVEHTQTRESTNCDDSFISSADSMWDKIGAFKEVDDECSDCSSRDDHCVGEPLNVNQAQETTNHGASSVSSGDSIWDKTGLPSRPKKAAHDHRIETYYDYFRLKSKGGVTTGTVEKSINHDNETNNRKGTGVINDPAQSSEDTLPPEVPLPVNATWRIVILMDHREFGCANNFLQMVEKRIDKYFGGKFSEITTLPSADYLYVARLISDTTGEVVDERVLDMVIERKNVIDVCSCLITDSKKFRPLSFFDAQMYKLQNCGVSQKLFLMEGDEDKNKNFFSGAKSEMEKERRLKRVKTLR